VTSSSPKGKEGFGKDILFFSKEGDYSLPHLYPPPPRGRGGTKEGEGNNNTIKPLPNWLAITDYKIKIICAFRG